MMINKGDDILITKEVRTFVYESDFKPGDVTKVVESYCDYNPTLKIDHTPDDRFVVVKTSDDYCINLNSTYYLVLKAFPKEMHAVLIEKAKRGEL